MIYCLRKSLGKFLFTGLCFIAVFFLGIFVWRNDSHIQHTSNISALRNQFILTRKYSELSHCEITKNSTFDCPDIRHLGKTFARQAHHVLTRLLRIFHLIAKKHNIRYWLYRGTLLGAVRHKGHNPFDDGFDIDIAILSTDFQKFLLAAPQELPLDIFLQTEETDGYWKSVPNSNMLAKLRDMKSCYKYCLRNGCKHKDGLQIDIFVVEQKHGYLIEKYSYKMSMLRYLLGPLKRPYSDVFPLHFMEFEGFLFHVPRRWDKVLKSLYQDYETLPKSVVKIPDIDVFRSCENLYQQNYEFPKSYKVKLN